MAEPWNKINIPYPGAASSCRISFTTGTAAVTEAVHVQCGRVLKLLDSRVLHIELRVLSELLYVLQNKLRQHTPFRAIKQVEQCVKRLKEMKLHGALQDLEELCPNEIQRNVGVDVGHCDVPSQPMLEWFCLKLLGASSLLCRTLDQCTKSFSLTRQHLHLSEFIVLNMVLSSMLSRLWVFFRGILRALVSVYQSVTDLLQEVVQCRPMAFLTDFTLPEDLSAFLGPPYSQMLEERSVAEPFGMKKTTKPSILDQMFEEGSEEQVEKGEEKEREMMQLLASEEMTSNTDLGRTVLRQGPLCSRSSSILDLKSMLQQTPKQHAAEVSIKRPSPGQPSTSSLSVLEQKRMFLKKLKTTSSVKDTAALLEEMMSWCRSCKLYKERRCLAFTLLKCQRIKALECAGISVQKKLRRLRISVHHLTLKGVTMTRPSQFHQRRTKCYFRTRFTTLSRFNGSVKSRVGKARMHSEIVKDLFNVTAKASHKCRKHTTPSPLHKDAMSGSDVLFNQKESNMKTNITPLKSVSVHKDDIDNIFASFGL